MADGSGNGADGGGPAAVIGATDAGLETEP